MASFLLPPCSPTAGILTILELNWLTEGQVGIGAVESVQHWEGVESGRSG